MCYFQVFLFRPDCDVLKEFYGILKKIKRNDLELKPRARPVVKPCSFDLLPLLLHDWLSRQRLKDRSGYKPFFGSQGRDG